MVFFREKKQAYKHIVPELSEQEADDILAIEKARDDARNLKGYDLRQIKLEDREKIKSSIPIQAKHEPGDIYVLYDGEYEISGIYFSPDKGGWYIRDTNKTLYDLNDLDAIVESDIIHPTSDLRHHFLSREQQRELFQEAIEEAQRFHCSIRNFDGTEITDFNTVHSFTEFYVYDSDNTNTEISLHIDGRCAFLWKISVTGKEYKQGKLLREYLVTLQDPSLESLIHRMQEDQRKGVTGPYDPEYDFFRLSA